MILNLILAMIVSLLQAIFALFPTVTIADIAYIGPTVSTTLTEIILKWNAFMTTFPYAQTGWNVFLYVILPFEILLLILKFFLGHRTPAHMN